MLKFSKRSIGHLNQLGSRLTGAATLLALLGTCLPAYASVPLRRAEIEQILNRVELIPRGRSARTARLSDFLAIGDALRTAPASRAELRFNDGSLARVGERATFHFIPNTRNFRLSNGTMLLLIPPGRGRSTIQTPSAVTGIQGSGLVVRHVEDRDLTMVMALTNNPAGAMTVTLADCDLESECTSEYALKAGQMALIQAHQVEVLEFDLIQFFETSPIIEGLELTDPDSTVDLGGGVNQVREEIKEALDQYQPLNNEQSILLNPAMISVTSTAESVVNQPWLLRPESSPTDLTADRSTLPLPAGLLIETSPSGSEVADQSGGFETPSRGRRPEPQAPSILVGSPSPTNPEVAPPSPTPEPGTSGGLEIEISAPETGNGSQAPGGEIVPPEIVSPPTGETPATGGGAIESPAPGGVESPAPGGVESPAPGGVESPAPGGVESLAPGGVESPAPGGVESPAPGGVESPAPGGVESPAPGGGDGVSAPNGGNGGPPPGVNPGGGIDNPAQPEVNPGEAAANNPGQPDVNPGGGIDNPGQPDVNPGEPGGGVEGGFADPGFEFPDKDDVLE